MGVPGGFWWRSFRHGGDLCATVEWVPLEWGSSLLEGTPPCSDWFIHPGSKFISQITVSWR